ncbi:MAG: Hsp33 family molecular chaperone HslO [Rubrivivax sp.]|jgi:molecular chaperone Hsp33
MLTRFLFEGLPVRGAHVRLVGPWRELLSRRQGQQALPPEVMGLLGEMTAAALLMKSHLKFDGALILQMHGDGPVKLAVAEVAAEGSFRATATLSDAVPAGADLPSMLNVGGKGRCAITLDPSNRRPGQPPYQGVVPLHGDRREDKLGRVQDVIEHYMLQSEQLDTRLVLAADGETAAGLLVQRMPLAGAGNLESRAAGGSAEVADDGPRNEDGIGRSEDFNRIAMLAGTLTPAELLALPAQELLRRLFWEETVRVFEPEQPHFACRCSRDRVAGMLRSLGRDESDSLIAERGVVEVGCEFCGRQYRFDAVDVCELFAPRHDAAPGSSELQ